MSSALTIGQLSAPRPLRFRTDPFLSARNVIFPRAAERCSAVTVESSFPVILPAVLAELRRFQRFEANWDGYEALPLDQGVIESAERFLTQYLSQPGDGFDRPSLMPTAEGGLSIEWRRGDVEFALELVPGGAILVYAEQGDQWWEGPLAEAPKFALETWAKASFPDS